jgi:hypothetical protein
VLDIAADARMRDAAARVPRDALATQGARRDGLAPRHFEGRGGTRQHASARRALPPSAAGARASFAPASCARPCDHDGAEVDAWNR